MNEKKKTGWIGQFIEKLNLKSLLFSLGNI